MSRSPCTLVKFALVGGYIHEQIVLVQKLPWVSLEQCSCTRKNRHFRRTREQIFFYLNIFIHGNLSDILRLSVLEMWQMWQSCKFASTIRLRIHLLSCERSSHARDWRETRAHISDSYMHTSFHMRRMTWHLSLQKSLKIHIKSIKINKLEKFLNIPHKYLKRDFRIKNVVHFLGVILVHPFAWNRTSSNTRRTVRIPLWANAPS